MDGVCVDRLYVGDADITERAVSVFTVYVWSIQNTTLSTMHVLALRMWPREVPSACTAPMLPSGWLCGPLAGSLKKTGSPKPRVA